MIPVSMTRTSLFTFEISSIRFTGFAMWYIRPKQKTTSNGPCFARSTS